MNQIKIGLRMTEDQAKFVELSEKFGVSLPHRFLQIVRKDTYFCWPPMSWGLSPVMKAYIDGDLGKEEICFSMRRNNEETMRVNLPFGSVKVLIEILNEFREKYDD